MATATRVPPKTKTGERPQNKTVQGLSKVLADTYTLYLKTHNFHWNVTGSRFQPLHGMFEEQYKDLAEAADEIAERIRALGHPAPGSYRAFSKLTSVQEADGEFSADEMIQTLTEDHEGMARELRTGISAAESAGDPVTAELLTDRAAVHEKTAWMLRSML